MKYRWPLGAVRPVRIPKRALCISLGDAGQPSTLQGAGGFRAALELSKVPCLAQNLSGFLEIVAHADLTLSLQEEALMRKQCVTVVRDRSEKP